MDDERRQTLWTSGLWAAGAALAMLAWVAFGNLAEDAGSGPYATLGGTTSEAERAAAGRLLDEAHGVLRSPEFRAAMVSIGRRHPVVYARPGDQDISPAEIADIVDLKPWGARYAPARALVVDDMGAELASAGESGWTSGRDADVLIGRPVLADYASGDTVRRSCAINVAAHEYAHTISLTPVGLTTAFTDTTTRQRAIPNRRNPATPVASYLIGAVAQCAWLARQGRIDREGVAACVEVFGVRSFNWARCRAFADGGEVAPRPGLPPPAPPL
jgi:hypothetical protein